MSRFVWSLMNHSRRRARENLQTVQNKHNAPRSNPAARAPALRCALCGDRAWKHTAEDWLCSQCKPQLAEVA